MRFGLGGGGCCEVAVHAAADEKARAREDYDARAPGKHEVEAALAKVPPLPVFGEVPPACALAIPYRVVNFKNPKRPANSMEVFAAQNDATKEKELQVISPRYAAGDCVFPRGSFWRQKRQVAACVSKRVVSSPSNALDASSDQPDPAMDVVR